MFRKVGAFFGLKLPQKQNTAEIGDSLTFGCKVLPLKTTFKKMS